MQIFLNLLSFAKIKLNSVVVSLKGSYDGVVFDQRDQVDFNVGDGAEKDVPEGVDHAIKKFKKGETSVLTLSPKYAFGAAGSQQFGVPADTTVTYEVGLLVM